MTAHRGNHRAWRAVLVCLICLPGLAALPLLTGCQQKQSPRPEVGDVSLGVAGFTQPQYVWELMAGDVPENQNRVDPEVLHELDRILAERLAAGPQEGQAAETGRGRDFTGPAVTRQCQEIVTFEQKGAATSALAYWVEVGRCLPVDYLLVPVLTDWRERQGGEMGAVVPAEVVMDLFVVDVKSAELVSRFHFEEAQMALSDNLLNLGSFFERGARWLTATELAAEGIDQGLTELGL